MLLTDGAGTVSWGAQPVAGLPSQTSNGGKLLTTDGTNASWSNAVTVSGNNATVTGTLAAGSGAHIFGNAAATAQILVQRITTDPSSIQLNAVSSFANIDFGSQGGGFTFGSIKSNGSEILRIHNGNFAAITPVSGGGLAVGGGLNVSATTASTSTSTGALVVSGGVGVGNEVSVYGRVRAQLGLHADGNVPAGLASAYQVDVQAGTSRDILSFGDSSRAGLIRGEQDGSGRATLKFGRYTASTFAEYLRITGVAATDAVLSVYGTTASTSTSSGALVVSGGVGVAGAINCGGDITAPTTANITGGRFTSVNSNSYIEQSGSDFNYVTASTRPHVFSIGGTTRFQVTTSGIISSLPASAASLTANSTMTFELTSNTSLKIFVRGSDGTTRSTTLTLA